MQIKNLISFILEIKIEEMIKHWSDGCVIVASRLFDFIEKIFDIK